MEDGKFCSIKKTLNKKLYESDLILLDKETPLCKEGTFKASGILKILFDNLIKKNELYEFVDGYFIYKNKNDYCYSIDNMMVGGFGGLVAYSFEICSDNTVNFYVRKKSSNEDIINEIKKMEDLVRVHLIG